MIARVATRDSVVWNVIIETLSLYVLPLYTLQYLFEPTPVKFNLIP